MKTRPNDPNDRDERPAATRPGELLISLGNRCQYRCQFCAYLKGRNPKVLSASAWISLLKDARNLGFKKLEIGGQGEPALFKGFVRIVHEARALGFRIKLLSNIQHKKNILAILPALSELTVNMNALDEKGFRCLHQPQNPASFNTAIDNLADGARLITEGRSSAFLNISYVVSKTTARSVLLFPKKLWKMLQQRTNIQHPVYVRFHHILMVPSNYHLCPDSRDLRRMIVALDKAQDNAFLMAHSNIRDFSTETKKLLTFYKLWGPFTADSIPGSKKHAAAGKISRHIWCDAAEKILFIDCDGDAFGCYNPTRTLTGIPARQDDLYLGNIQEVPVRTMLRRASKIGCFHPDITRRSWKVCAACGLRTTWMPPHA